MGSGGHILEKRRLESPSNLPYYESMQVFSEALSTGDSSQIRSPFSNALQSLATCVGYELVD